MYLQQITDGFWMAGRKSNGKTIRWGIWDRKQEKKVSGGQDMTGWKFLGELHEGVPHQLQSSEDGISKQACVRTTTKTKKENIKFCVCSLSLSLSLSLSSWCFISLCLTKAVDLFFILCFSLLDDYWQMQ